MRTGERLKPIGKFARAFFQVDGIGASISFSLLRCVMREDKVASFFPRVAGKTAFH
jgi:hypothetical protein